MKAFIFNGMTITPKRQFSKEEKEKGLCLPIRSIGISNYSYMKNRKNDIYWNYGEFYNEASKVGASEIDVFELNGMDVIPCNNELFQLIKK
jgi:hypothetical protein